MTDYQVSKGKIADPLNPGVNWVWSAFAPRGERIMNGSDMFFYTEWEAIDACHEHERQGREAA